MIVDDVTIELSGGKGGDGIVAFSGDKMTKGPTGGNGGKGGDVYFIGTTRLDALNKFRYVKKFSAENGKRGKNKGKDGSEGKNLFLEVPVGTVIHKNDSIEEIVQEGESILIAKGGNGGHGNFFFCSSTNTSPKEFEFGKSGESVSVRLELKLIADIGIIGLPNSGKSSLLNLLTKAKAKTAPYGFTTLKPNLGVCQRLIIADIPGLIEGASRGKGLGIKFLRHIERTKILFHLISSESKDLIKDYKTIRKEIEDYRMELSEKKEFLFLSKTDLLNQERIQEKLALFEALNLKIMPISILDEVTIKKLHFLLDDIGSDIRNK